MAEEPSVRRGTLAYVKGHEKSRRRPKFILMRL